VRVTVPVVFTPPVTVAKASATDETVGAFIVRVAVFATPYVAVMVAGVEALTAVVVTWNVAVVAPAATVTVAGTVADALLLASVTEAAAAAAPFRVTVAVEGAPPTTVAGFKPTDAMTGLTSTLRLAVAV
jgi:hydrogenase maturation factor